MATVARSVVSLRISGDSLVPEEVSALIGASPDFAYRKGELVHCSGGRVAERRTGLWLQKAEPKEPEDIDSQVHELLAGLTQDLEIWAGLAAKFEMDLFCGLFMNESNEGLSLSVATLRALAERSIEIGFDVYGPTHGTSGEAEA